MALTREQIASWAGPQGAQDCNRETQGRKVSNAVPAQALLHFSPRRKFSVDEVSCPLSTIQCPRVNWLIPAKGCEAPGALHTRVHVREVAYGEGDMGGEPERHAGVVQNHQVKAFPPADFGERAHWLNWDFNIIKIGRTVWFCVFINVWAFEKVSSLFLPSFLIPFSFSLFSFLIVSYREGLYVKRRVELPVL